MDGALAEAARALDELHAHGVMVLSNTHGRYLGDSAFEPLWAELDAPAAVVLVHPTAPPGVPVPEVPPPLADFPYDTTRAALHLTMRGVPRRYPRMRTILPHAGGFLPYVRDQRPRLRDRGRGAAPTALLRPLTRDPSRRHRDAGRTAADGGAIAVTCQ